MIIDELNKKISDIENLANDKTGSLESKVNDLTDGILMVADAVDTIPEMVDEKLAVVTKEITAVKEQVKKVKTIKGDKGEPGTRGEPGMDGIDGIDGSPDSGKDIAGKLNKLEDVLDPKIIKGSSEYVNKTDLNKTISTLENQTRFLIQANQNNSNSGGLTSVTTDSTMTGNGTTASPLSVVATSASDVAVTVRAATTAALAGTWTYNNGTSGVGATLTRTTNGALPNQDGVSLSDGDRFLIKNQASTLVNGVYVLTQKGVTSVSPTIFTRATDADETSELDELVVTISEGSTNRGTVWGQQTNNPVVGTSAITFATVVSTAVTQATSGTQAINQIPLYTGTARQLTRGTANFKYNPTNNLFTIRGIDYTFPANNGDASQVLTTDGSGTLSWETGGGGTPAGSDTQIQYNNAGSFGADAGFFKGDETFGLGLLQTQQSTVTFTGSGLDDLTVAGLFSGTVPTTYTVTIDGVNQDFLLIDNSTITGGVFNVGDTITSGTGGNATVLSISTVVVPSFATLTCLRVTVTSPFTNNESVDNGLGVSGTLRGNVQTIDTIEWTDGVVTETNYPITAPLFLNNGIVCQIARTGHTLTDSWTWDYTNVQNNILDFSNGTYKFGTDFGTDYFGYEVGNNILGFGLKGSLNTYTNVAGDIGLSGLSNTIQPQIIDQLNFVDGNSVTQSLLKNQYDIEVNNGTELSAVGMTATTFNLNSNLSSGEHGISQSAGVVTTGNLSGGNNTKITVDDVNEHITISNLPAYDDDTAAGVGGLTAGMVYMTTGSGSAPLNAAGILMIKQ